MGVRSVTETACPNCGGTLIEWTTRDGVEIYCEGDRDDGAGCGWL
jgi:hypothetical protein